MVIRQMFLFCIVPLLLFAACKSPSERLMDNFKKADDSLKGANAVVLGRDSLTILNLAILARQQQNPRLAVTADSLYLLTITAIDFIDSIKNTLTAKDTSGENTGLAIKLMEYKNTGILLYEYISGVYHYSVKSIITTSKGRQVDSSFADIASIPSASIFIQKYFKGTPTTGAITILTKFKVDCTRAAAITLNDIKDNLVKRQ